MQFIRTCGTTFQRQSSFKSNAKITIPKRWEGDSVAGKKRRGRGGLETPAAMAKKSYRPLDQDEHNWEELLLKITAPFPPRKLTPEQESIENKIREEYQKGIKGEEAAAFEYTVSLHKRRDLAIKALPPALMASASKAVEESEVFDQSYWIPRDQFHIPGPNDYPPQRFLKPTKK